MKQENMLFYLYVHLDLREHKSCGYEIRRQYILLFHADKVYFIVEFSHALLHQCKLKIIDLQASN